MTDPRNKKLAKILVEYSVRVKKGEKVLISCSNELGLPLAKEVFRLSLIKGAYPHLELSAPDLGYLFYKHATKEQLETEPEILKFLYQWEDKLIAIRTDYNTKELTSVDLKKIQLRLKTVEEIKNIYLTKPWIVISYPTHSLAQDAAISLDELENIYFKACLQDWTKIGQTLRKLKQIIDEADKVEIKGRKTHLTLSLKGRLSQLCDGKFNMPDGEVFAAPVDSSANGYIYFEFPTNYQGVLGREVKDIYLEFKNGRVVKAKASQNQKGLEKILKTDEGAKRLGEFALGTNYRIKRYFNNVAFDEKIGGTIHLALGQAFPEREGGGKNRSAIHWDIVKDMRKKGSQILVDGKVILQDGRLVNC